MKILVSSALPQTAAVVYATPRHDHPHCHTAPPPPLPTLFPPGPTTVLSTCHTLLTPLKFHHRYAHLPPDSLPLSECLKDNVARFMPAWTEDIAPAIKSSVCLVPCPSLHCITAPSLQSFFACNAQNWLAAPELFVPALACRHCFCCPNITTVQLPRHARRPRCSARRYQVMRRRCRRVQARVDGLCLTAEWPPTRARSDAATATEAAAHHNKHMNYGCCCNLRLQIMPEDI